MNHGQATREVPRVQIEGHALIVIPGPEVPRRRKGRIPVMADILNQITSVGMTAEICTNAADGLAALRARRFDLVVTELDMPEAWDICAEVFHQRQRGETKAGVVLQPPRMDFDSGSPKEEGVDSVWMPIVFPCNLLELKYVMKRFREPTYYESQHPHASSYD